MPDFVETLNDHGRAEWYKLLQEMGLAYGQKKKMIEINTKLEEVESIDKIMRQVPGQDKRDAD